MQRYVLLSILMVNSTNIIGMEPDAKKTPGTLLDLLPPARVEMEAYVQPEAGSFDKAAQAEYRQQFIGHPDFKALQEHPQANAQTLRELKDAAQSRLIAQHKHCCQAFPVCDICCTCIGCGLGCYRLLWEQNCIGYPVLIASCHWGAKAVTHLYGKRKIIRGIRIDMDKIYIALHALRSIGQQEKEHVE